MEALGPKKGSLRDFSHVVFKHNNRITLFFAATFFTVAIGTVIIEPTYEASSQILVKVGREKVYVPPSSNMSPVIEWNRSEQSLLLRQEAGLQAELHQTLGQEAETRNRVQELGHQLAITPKTIPQGQETDLNPYLINTLQAQLVELELKEKKLLTQYTEQSRLASNVREEIAIIREKLAEQETKRCGRMSSGLNPTYQRLQEKLFKNKAELKALAAKKETQSAHLTAYRKTLKGFSRVEVKLPALQDEVDLNRQKYRLYLTEFEDSRISNAMNAERIAGVNLIDRARPPARPVGPKVTLNMLLAVSLGGFGNLGPAFFLEFLDDSLEKPEDVEIALQLPVLASIPELKEVDQSTLGRISSIGSIGSSSQLRCHQCNADLITVK